MLGLKLNSVSKGSPRYHQSEAEEHISMHFLDNYTWYEKNKIFKISMSNAYGI